AVQGRRRRHAEVLGGINDHHREAQRRRGRRRGPHHRRGNRTRQGADRNSRSPARRGVPQAAVSRRDQALRLRLRRRQPVVPRSDVRTVDALARTDRIADLPDRDGPGSDPKVHRSGAKEAVPRAVSRDRQVLLGSEVDVVPPDLRGSAGVGGELHARRPGEGQRILRWAFGQGDLPVSLRRHRREPDRDARRVLHQRRASRAEEVRGAQASGIPAPYDYGQMRAAWVSPLLTNWIGDDGWLAEMDLQLRGFNYHGDVHRCTGTVTAMGDGADDPVALDVFATSQRDETTTRGTAKVLLPSKTTGAVVLPIPDADLRRRGAQVVSRVSGKVGEEMRRLYGE